MFRHPLQSITHHHHPSRSSQSLLPVQIIIVPARPSRPSLGLVSGDPEAFADGLGDFGRSFLIIGEGLDAGGGFLLVIEELDLSAVVDLAGDNGEAGVLVVQADGRLLEVLLRPHDLQRLGVLRQLRVVLQERRLEQLPQLLAHVLQPRVLDHRVQRKAQVGFLQHVVHLIYKYRGQGHYMRERIMPENRQLKLVGANLNRTGRSGKSWLSEFAIWSELARGELLLSAGAYQIQQQEQNTNRCRRPTTPTSSRSTTYCAGVTHPLDLVKTRFQSHDGKSAADNLVPRYSGVKNALAVIYKDEGLRGLYKGFYISLLCQASSMAFFFGIYEARKERLEAEGRAKLEAVVVASTEASLAATLLTQPVWVVKTRMLLNVDPRISELQNCRKAVREIAGQHGWRGFLKGLQLSLLLSCAGVVQMYTYESAKTLYEGLAIPESALGEKHFLCGSLSKLLSALATYPITTLRTRVQQNQFSNGRREGKYGGAWEAARRTLREEGVRGFYKGMTANLVKGVSQKGIYFCLYEIFKERLFKGRAASH